MRYFVLVWWCCSDVLDELGYTVQKMLAVLCWLNQSNRPTCVVNLLLTIEFGEPARNLQSKEPPLKIDDVTIGFHACLGSLSLQSPEFICCHSEKVPNQPFFNGNRSVLQRSYIIPVRSPKLPDRRYLAHGCLISLHFRHMYLLSLRSCNFLRHCGHDR